MRFIRLNCFRRSPIAIWMRIVILIMRLIASVLLHAHATFHTQRGNYTTWPVFSIQMARVAQLVRQLMNPAKESVLPLSLSLFVILLLCISLSLSSTVFLPPSFPLSMQIHLPPRSICISALSRSPRHLQQQHASRSCWQIFS